MPNWVSNVVAVAAGDQFTVALKADHTVAAWGLDWNGQCQFPDSVTNVVAVSAGAAHSLVMLGKPDAPPRLVKTARAAGQFKSWVQTVAGRNYALESTPALASAGWSTVCWVRGNGAMQLLVDP